MAEEEEEEEEEVSMTVMCLPFWKLEQYLKASKIEDEEETMSIRFMHLTDDVMLWWCQRYVDI